MTGRLPLSRDCGNRPVSLYRHSSEQTDSTIKTLYIMATQTAPAKTSKVKQAAKLGVFTLMIMNIVAVVSLRGLPAEAEYGMSSAFYYLFAALVFLIPVSLVAAELAAMFPYQQGGMFRWIGEAFGSKLGFLGIWLQWVESTIWFPTVLTFGAVSLAFIGMDHVADSHLAANKLYTIAVVLAIYWIATLISLKGLGWVGKISKIGGMVGTIIPAILLVVCGVIYLASGGHSEMNFHGDFWPDLTNFDNVVLAASIFLFYAGMEMSGVHVRDISNPAVNYPKAVFGGALVTVLIFVLGTYALGVIIPAKDINLVQSLLVGFDNYFQAFHMEWFTPIIAIALAFGVLAGVLTWVAGPSKGVFAVGQAGYLPKFFQKTNKAGVQEGKNAGMAPLAYRVVTHGVYCMPFFVNPNYAHKSGCTADDIELLKLLIPYAYDMNRSAIRPDVRLRHAWYIEHKHLLGSCPEYLLFEALTPKKIGSQDDPSMSWSDYEDQLALPDELRARVDSCVDLVTL